MNRHWYSKGMSSVVPAEPRLAEPPLSVRPAATPGEAAARAALARGSVYGGAHGASATGLREGFPRGHRPGGTVARPAAIGRKSPAAAALLSFLLAGAGQWYCGRAGRGFAFLAGALLSALLGIVLIGFVLLPLVVLWAGVDAAKLASGCNDARATELTAG
jgi:TM2 domain-containing membrane protein YozV